MRLIVVGNVCLDTTFSLRHLPQPGETVNGMLAAEGLGGKGGNQAVAAARVGAEVLFFAAIGSDAAGEHLIAQLGADLLTDHLLQMPLASDRSTILVDAQGENVIVSAVACATAFDPLSSTELASHLRAGDMLLMQGNLTPQVTRACLDLARLRGARTILNPSPLVPDEKPDFSSVGLLIVNRQEAAVLAGTVDMESAAQGLLRLGAEAVIITLGAKGCLCKVQADLAPAYHFAPRVAAIDTSGAGDCFAGTVAGLLSLGKPLAVAAKIAMQAAAVSVCRAGTVAAFPSRAEFAALLTTFEREHP